MSVKKQVTKSVLWSAIERFSVQGIQFLLSIVIARQLLPSDYGLVAMLSIFMAIAQTFIDGGFANALIQKKDRSETDYSTVFYFNVVISVFVYLLLYLLSPLIADFYNEEQLVIITRWVGINIIITAFSIVQRAKLTIQIDFKSQAKASLSSVCISGIVGLFLAYTGQGVWALIFQNITNNILNTVLLWIYAKWSPSWTFSWDSFKKLFSFGSKLLASGLLHTVYINLYSLAIGRYYKASDVGYYNRAYSLAQFPSINIVSIISRVVYPMQCSIQDDDKQLEASFTLYLHFSCFIIFPLMILLSVLSKPLILFILTDKWIEAAGLLSILCIAYAWYPILVLNNNILNVKGRSDYFLKAEIIKKSIAVVILLLTLPYGVRILCWGLVLYNILDFVIIVYFAKKVINTGYFLQIKTVFPVLLLSVGMGGVVYLFINVVQNIFLQLFGGGLVGVFIFLFVGYLFRLEEIIYIKNKITRKYVS